MLGKNAYIGAIAKKYEADRISQTIWEKEQQYIENTINSLQNNETVLDIPVGTGRFIPLYEAKGLTIIASDISSDMLNEARKKAENLSLIKFQVEDAEALTLASHTCDHIVCWRLTHLVPPSSLDRIFLEFSRVVKKTVYMQFFYIQPTSNILQQAVQKVKKLLSTVLSSNRPGNALPTEEPWGHIQTFVHSHRHIQSASRAAGLTLVKIDKIEDKHNPELIYVFEKTT